MASQGWLILIIVGAVLIVLGLGGLLWGKREERSYYDALTTREDLREFFSRWPMRPEPASLKIGGWIAIATGIVLVVIGGIFKLVG